MCRCLWSYLRNGSHVRIYDECFYSVCTLERPDNKEMFMKQKINIILKAVNNFVIKLTNNLPSCVLLEHLNVKAQNEDFKLRCPFFSMEKPIQDCFHIPGYPCKWKRKQNKEAVSSTRRLLQYGKLLDNNIPRYAMYICHFL
jgi:hypothetical protein